MPGRSPRDELRIALETIRSVEYNRKPLRYAPWVLGLMAVIFFRDRTPSFDANDWLAGLAGVAAMPFLFRFAARLLEQQKERAEATIERVLASGRGLKDWTQIQTGTKRYRGLPLGERVQRAVINAALVQEKRDEHRRAQVLRDETRAEPALVR